MEIHLQSAAIYSQSYRWQRTEPDVFVTVEESTKIDSNRMKQHTSKEFTYPARIIQMNANAAAAIAAARAFARAASADYGDAGF